MLGFTGNPLQLLAEAGLGQSWYLCSLKGKVRYVEAFCAHVCRWFRVTNSPGDEGWLSSSRLCSLQEVSPPMAGGQLHAEHLCWVSKGWHEHITPPTWAEYCTVCWQPCGRGMGSSHTPLLFSVLFHGQKKRWGSALEPCSMSHCQMEIPKISLWCGAVQVNNSKTASHCLVRGTER